MRDRLAAARSEEEEAGAPSAGLAAREATGGWGAEQIRIRHFGRDRGVLRAG